MFTVRSSDHSNRAKSVAMGKKKGISEKAFVDQIHIISYTIQSIQEIPSATAMCNSIFYASPEIPMYYTYTLCHDNQRTLRRVYVHLLLHAPTPTTGPPAPLPNPGSMSNAFAASCLLTSSIASLAFLALAPRGRCLPAAPSLTKSIR